MSTPGEWIEEFYKPKLDVTKVDIRPEPLPFHVSSNDPERIKNIYERVHWTAWMEEKMREEDANGKAVQTEPLLKLEDLLLRPEPEVIRDDSIWNSTDIDELRKAFQQTRDEYRQLRAFCISLYNVNGALKQQLQETQTQLQQHDVVLKEKQKEIDRLFVAKKEYEKMIYSLNRSVGAFRNDLVQSQEESSECRRALHMKCLEMQHVSVESMQLQEETKKHFIFIENEAKNTIIQLKNKYEFEVELWKIKSSQLFQQLESERQRADSFQRGFEVLRRHYNPTFSLDSIPPT